MKKKLIEANPLVRWCPKAGCEGFVTAANDKATKLVCPDCKTRICFKCRNDWHGRWTSCTKALDKKFAGWAKENENISYCPKCKTRLEKVSGCNHMTCYFCNF
jgi:E3 ubiquitin-protein ligase RNF19A